ncbi:MAG: 23S rRNA (adenine(2503)-C(2))-methyltransferase RlmN, partial [Lachnospiraceae bacterium]|nr:23S rRNA (adenine(2503)-C(2))-methyltransferase RlmN [Lachnospiraceae bacterium]
MLYDLRSMTEAECRGLMKDLGEKEYRGSQLFDWIHGRRCGSIDDMTNLSKALRERLKETCRFEPAEVVRHLVSKIDGTEKFAFRLPDGNVIETVLMKY